MSSISDNLQTIRTRITAASSYQIDPSARDVKLIAVSKFQSIDAVRRALSAGQRVFGENRVQEAKSKFVPLRAEYADIELHLIGQLQTNKAEDAVRLFDVVQTVDRPAIAEALAKAGKKIGYTPRFYVEVNIGNEPQKAGVIPEQLADFLKLCEAQYALEISGLMCIPPMHDDPRPYFIKLRELAMTHNLARISMGMSEDFEIAIAEGATEVRVGTAIFGERPTAILS